LTIAASPTRAWALAEPVAIADTKTTEEKRRTQLRQFISIPIDLFRYRTGSRATAMLYIYHKRQRISPMLGRQKVEMRSKQTTTHQLI
jgi:hypothetical protein